VPCLALNNLRWFLDSKLMPVKEEYTTTRKSERLELRQSLKTNTQDLWVEGLNFDELGKQAQLQINRLNLRLRDEGFNYTTYSENNSFTFIFQD
jgi:hypothetical protein